MLKNSLLNSQKSKFWKRMSWNIMDHQEFFLWIIVSFAWTFFGLGVWVLEGFYTRPTLFGAPFLPDNKNLEASTPKF